MQQATIIKGGAVPSGTRAFELTDMLVEAHRTLADARGEAERIIADAKSEAELIRDEAMVQAEQVRQQYKEEGVREGRNEGSAAGRAEALAEARDEFQQEQQQLMATCRSVVEEIERERAAWHASARRHVVELAMAVARRVVKHVGQREAQVVSANLEEAVRLVGVRTDVTFAVNPRDVQAAQQFADGLLSTHDGWKHVRIAADSDVERGGCRMRWDTGAVDAGLETQLKRIADALRESDDPTPSPVDEEWDST